MTYMEPLSQIAVAVSISESPDMHTLGLGEEHLEDAMAEIARHLLAMGARLVYGGDLRALGFTELLFELATRHRRDADIGDNRPAIASYLPWPAHASKTREELRAWSQELQGIAEFHYLDIRGQEVSIDSLPAAAGHAANDKEWAEALTSMRAVLTKVADARVVLGGRVTGYKGCMPGIAEEVLFSVKSNQPVFLLGGFGGCASDIACELDLLALRSDIQRSWAGRSEFQALDWTHLHNGLDEDENRTLARTVYVDEAVCLILRGLLRLAATWKHSQD